VGEWEIRFCCVLVFVQGIGAHVYAPLRLIGGMGNQVLLCFGVYPGDWGARLCAPTLPDVGEWEIRFCCVLVFVQGIGAHVYAPLRCLMLVNGKSGFVVFW
ncbi:MAG: hypothetical protein RID90_10410, partial [Marinovum algicola]